MVVSELKFESEPIVDENGETVSTLAGGITVSGGKGVFVFDAGNGPPTLLLETIIDSTNLGSEDDFVLTISDFSVLSSIPSLYALPFYQVDLGTTSGLLFAVGNNYEVTIFAFWNCSPVASKTFDGSQFDETDEHTLVFSRTSNVYSVSVDGTPLSATSNTLDSLELPSFVGYSLGAGLSTGLSPTNTMYIGNIKLEKGASTYTVAYDGNGNTGGTVPVDSNDYDGDDTVTVLGNTGSLVKNGYTFDGWNTAADGSGTDYAPAATFSITSNTTLYAQWAESGDKIQLKNISLIKPALEKISLTTPCLIKSK